MDISGLNDAQILGLTAAAEARAYLDPKHGWTAAPIENMVAVMCVIRNRVATDPVRFGTTITGACLKPGQFSCWTPGSGSNHEWLEAQVQAVQGKTLPPNSLVAGIIAQAERVINEKHDIVNGATHYYSPVSMVPPGRVPDWAVDQKPVATIGDHLFFVNV